jgi:MraZ protein
MAIPARYRQRLQESCDGQLVVTVDKDHCLLVYPMPEWEEIERKLVKLPSLNKQARKLQRLIIGHATECELDSHGRILLPPLLREFASIEKRAVLIGQGNKFELWDEQTWNDLRDGWLSEEEQGDFELPTEMEHLSL